LFLNDPIQARLEKMLLSGSEFGVAFSEALIDLGDIFQHKIFKKRSRKNNFFCCIFTKRTP
jgi:hypothetical protein